MAFLQIDYKSEALMRSVNIKVILPTDGLSGKWEPPYKTLYLLPGYSVNATELITYLGLRRQSELKGIAIVLPDGENLFYQNIADRMTFYSTYIGKELVKMTRKILPLSTRREDTFLGGISMGGYGALYNGIKYRDTFSKVAAFSPAADAYMLMTDGAPGFSFEQFCGIFGSRQAYYGSKCDLCAQWTRRDMDNRPELFLCCGKEDRIVYDAVKKFEDALRKENIPHIYCSGHGDHELDYWEQMLDPAFSFLAGIEAGTKNRLIIQEGGKEQTNL